MSETDYILTLERDIQKMKDFIHYLESEIQIKRLLIKQTQSKGTKDE